MTPSLQKILADKLQLKEKDKFESGKLPSETEIVETEEDEGCIAKSAHGTTLRPVIFVRQSKGKNSKSACTSLPSFSPNQENSLKTFKDHKHPTDGYQNKLRCNENETGISETQDDNFDQLLQALISGEITLDDNFEDPQLFLDTSKKQEDTLNDMHLLSASAQNTNTLNDENRYRSFLSPEETDGFSSESVQRGHSVLDIDVLDKQESPSSESVLEIPGSLQCNGVSCESVKGNMEHFNKTPDCNTQ